MITVDRAITLTEPWASLVAIGAKSIETRSWPTKYRGWIAIHAAKGFPKDCREFAQSRLVANTLYNAGILSLSFGHVIAVVSLGACLSTNEPAHVIDAVLAAASGDEFKFGNYGPDRYGFVMRGVRRLREPIPMKGMLGIWRMPRTITQADLA